MHVWLANAAQKSSKSNELISASLMWR